MLDSGHGDVLLSTSSVYKYRFWKANCVLGADLAKYVTADQITVLFKLVCILQFDLGV